MRADLERRLQLTLLVTRDFQPMAKRLDEARAVMEKATTTQTVPDRVTEAKEAVELIDWLKDANFILTGYAWFPFDTQNGKHPEKGLGLFAGDGEERRVLDEVIGEIAATRRGRAELYSFYRTDYMTVVRSVAQLRYFGVAQPGPDGKHLGEHVFVGLLSTKGLKLPNRRVPVIGKRIADVIAKLEEPPGSYAYTKIIAILDSLPSEDLFYWTIDEIKNVAEHFRQTESRDQARAFVMRRPNGRRIAIVCVVPRMRFSEALREKLSQDIRKALGVPFLREYRVETDDESPIRMHFTVGRYRPGVSDADLHKLEDELEHLLESWDDRLRGLVFKRYKRIESTTHSQRYLTTMTSAQDVWTRFGARFPESYKTTPPEIALRDIGLMDSLEGEPLRVMLVVLGDANDRHTSLRIVSTKELLLNDVVPVLHRMALRTTSRLAEKLVGPGPDVYITGFEVSGNDGKRIEDPKLLDRLATIIQRVLLGQLHDDRLLGLGYLAELDWREIDLLITYRNYLVQVFQGFGTQGVDEALLKHPHAAALLVEYFEAKFSTERSESARRAHRARAAADRAGLRGAAALGDGDLGRPDPALFPRCRRCDATNKLLSSRAAARSSRSRSRVVRSSTCRVRARCTRCTCTALAWKVSHLRGAKVARGGIRHSDRADDFRTEVLGLQRTQTLKNTVIVPSGAKGGFVTKKQIANREEAAAEAKRQYEHFISGLLDVTDTYVTSNGVTTILPPPGVLRYDDDDPYLVVAADKGTAHLSDTANAISQRYKFWLDDAFASGGSAGYDHKVMGITSRGGWTNVERHFREMGIDIRKTSIKVAGVGDMSGDVFGNGMLLNDKLRLVGAFNHKHVFLDPAPDMAASYAERKRLFQTPGTQWSDYKKDAISKGGGVFERAAKEITLSPEAKGAAGPHGEYRDRPRYRARDPDARGRPDVVPAASGPYVKSSAETNGEAGDKVNDNVRVNAIELRAKVIGEGANLAITQRARTEYALHGGRCNTDAIDNSARCGLQRSRGQPQDLVLAAHAVRAADARES